MCIYNMAENEKEEVESPFANFWQVEFNIKWYYHNLNSLNTLFSHIKETVQCCRYVVLWTVALPSTEQIDTCSLFGKCITSFI